MQKQATPPETQVYRDVTLTQFQEAMHELGERMFRLFDATGHEYDNSNGDSLMWACSFTASLCATDAIDQSITRKCSLVDGLIYALIAIRDGSTKEALEKMLTLDKE